VLSDGLTVAHVRMCREAPIAYQVNCVKIKDRIRMSNCKALETWQ
jgi:hypothetical protein